MSLDYRAIGKRMAERRKQLGLKQYQVCELLDVNYKYLSNLETGRSSPSLEMVIKLCEVLQTTPDYLLLGISHYENIESNYDIIKKIDTLNEKNKIILNGIIEILNNTNN